MAGGSASTVAGVNVLERIRRRRPPGPVLPARAWFDEPDASDRIADHVTDEADRAVLGSWVRDGYAIVENVVPHDLLDAMVDDLDTMFTGDETFAGVGLHDLVMPDGHPGDAFLREAAHGLSHDHRINHSTIQIETAPDHGQADC